MKAQILDQDALTTISPPALSAFARGEGWRRIEPFGRHSDVYAADGRPELVIPRSQDLTDYAQVVSELIRIFAETANRDPLALYRDLVGADRDLVRVRVNAARDDGSVSVDSGVKLVTASRDMLLAAACAAVNPQPLFRAGANKEASDYMQRVRLGQTEHGSFVLTLLAPVPPQLQPPLDPAWADLDDEPFERKVTRRLMDALGACRVALEQASVGGGMEALERAVAVGVSANLCESVASLAEISDGLEIGLTWAQTRPGPEPYRRVRFSSGDAEVLREGARNFRAHRSRHDVQLFGTVHQLKRDQDEMDGLVTLKALVDDKIQSVRTVLDQASYSSAVKAHDQRLPVVVRGDLERVGQRWQLTGADLLTVGTDDNAEDRSTN